MFYMTQLTIAWAMFKEEVKRWSSEVFGSGVKFPTEHVAPGHIEGYAK